MQTFSADQLTRLYDGGEKPRGLLQVSQDDPERFDEWLRCERVPLVPLLKSILSEAGEGEGDTLRQKLLKLLCMQPAVQQKVRECEGDFTSDELGLFEFKGSRYKESVVHWRKAVEAEPDNAAYLNNLASALSWCDQKNSEEAEDLYRKAVEAEPDNARIRRNLFGCFAKSQKYEEAEAILLQTVPGLEVYSQLYSFYEDLAFQLLRQDKYEESEIVYRKAIEFIQKVDNLLPNSTVDEITHELRMGLAGALLGQGQYQEAEEIFLEERRLNPQSSHLAMILSKFYRNLSELLKIDET